MQSLVQFRVNKGHGVLYDLIERLSSVEDKGYMAEQLRNRLKAFETLSKLVGDDEPFHVVAKLSAAWELLHPSMHIEKPGIIIDDDIDDDILTMADFGE